MKLIIEHQTAYDYERPVKFGQQRLLLRPRDSHATRLLEAGLTLSPPGKTRWVYDALGNCVCWFTPRLDAARMVVDSRLVIERFPAPLAPIVPDDPDTAAPIVYSAEDRAVLAPFIRPATEDDSGTLLKWLRSHIGRPDEQVLDFLLRLNEAIHSEFGYNPRAEEGVQEPWETIAKACGTCRDFAWLMVESLRRLGYAARFVTGYLYDPNCDGSSMRGAGATHAWCDVFLPGLGWTEFDPTNGLAESADLIPVAVARTPAGAAPVSGYLLSNPGVSSMMVTVNVRPFNPADACPPTVAA